MRVLKKKNKVIATLFLGLVVTLNMLAKPNEEFNNMIRGLLQFNVPTIEATTLHKWLLTKQIILLDAREYSEFKVSHISGAKYFGYNKPRWNLLKNIGKNQIVVIYCSVGYRSEKIGQKLKSANYKNVYNLYGGIFQWSNERYPMVNRKQKTNQIHGYNKRWAKWITNGKVLL